MPQVLNKRSPRVAGLSTYIGRPSPWGNPFVIGRDGNRKEVVAMYEAWLLGQPQLMAKLHMLQGRNLVCWCAPLACHGDVLLHLANQAAPIACEAINAPG